MPGKQDTWIWIYSHSNNYTVKQAYNSIIKSRLQSSSTIWKKIVTIQNYIRDIKFCHGEFLQIPCLRGIILI